MDSMNSEITCSCGGVCGALVSSQVLAVADHWLVLGVELVLA